MSGSPKNVLMGMKQSLHRLSASMGFVKEQSHAWVEGWEMPGQREGAELACAELAGIHTEAIALVALQHLPNAALV